MAGVGHLSVFGIGDWASKMKGVKVNIVGYTDAGKYLTDTIRFGNAVQTWFNAIASSINWQMQKRLVWPAGISLGIGGIIGAQAGIWSTGGQVAPAVYMGIFGLATYLIAGYMLYQLTPRAKRGKKAGKEATQKFMQRVKELREQGRLHELEGIKNLKVSFIRHYLRFLWRTQKYIPPDYLFILFAILAIYVGTGYVARGFFNIRLPGV